MRYHVGQIDRWIGAIAAALVLCACSETSGELSGSLGDSYDLSFDHARARLYSAELAVEYVAHDGQVPVRVSVRRGDEGISAKTYDLVERGDITGQRGDTRIPRFISGKIEFDKFEPRNGGAVEGSFEATFETGRDQSVLNGSFRTTLELVDGPRGYGYDADAAGEAGDANAVGDASSQPDTTRENDP